MSVDNVTGTNQASKDDAPSNREPDRHIDTVYVQYGPYETCTVVEHSVTRLQGLQNILTTAGYDVVLDPINDWDVMQIQLHGRIVFKCDIKELDYDDAYIKSLLLRKRDAPVKSLGKRILTYVLLVPVYLPFAIIFTALAYAVWIALTVVFVVLKIVTTILGVVNGLVRTKLCPIPLRTLRRMIYQPKVFDHMIILTQKGQPTIYQIGTSAGVQTDKSL